MAVIVSDSFAAYADGALPTVSGGVYAKPSDWPNPIAIASHLAKGTASGDNACYLSSYAGSAVAQWAAVTVATHDDFMGPTVFNSAVGDFYFWDVRSGGWQVYRVRSNQVFTAIASGGWGTNPAPGDVFQLEAVIVAGDPTLTVRKNGVNLWVVTDSPVGKILSGVPGLRLWNTGARVSKFEAGDFAVTPPAGGAGEDRTRLALEPTFALSAAPLLGGGFA